MTQVPSIQIQLVAQVGALQLDVALDTQGETLVLVGPNGAGKTSLLSALLGVLRCAQGRIVIGEQVLLDTRTGACIAVEARRLGYVPQDYALFPHLNVHDNVAFALRASATKWGRVEQASVEQVLADFGLEALATRRVQTLSGGEKQRVALARSLSVKPRALLLDEPLAALDLHARAQVRSYLATMLNTLRLPAIVVTHDPADARALAGRIAVLEQGRITQLGAWDALVENPASSFVAAFVARA